MVFDYNLNGAELPWMYKKEKYAGKKSESMARFNLPKVQIGEKYYVKLSEIGWSAVIIKSLLMVDNESFVIVSAPNGKEYGIRSSTEFFRTIEDAKLRAANPNYDDYARVTRGCVGYVGNENVIAQYKYINLPYQKKYAFVGYIYKNEGVKEVNFEIDYLWLDYDGLHYRISTKEETEDVYKTKDECIANNFTFVDFDGNSEEDRDLLKKFTIMVEVYAEDVEQARLMIKVE